MIKYIHIGYPKNLSTTLQRDFFARHPQIYHLGIGVGSNVGYIDSEISAACENYFIYSRDYSYNLKKDSIKSAFEKHFSTCKKSSTHHACGMSLEHISFSFTPDNIDLTAKASRLKDIFGADTKIIMIIREQGALLKSLFRESIRMGYSGRFSDFIRYTYLFQDRNFATEFFYDNTFELFARYFGRDNIFVLPVEEAREASGELKIESGKKVIISKLCNALGLDYYDNDFGHHNKALSGSQLAAKMIINKTEPHDLGNAVYGNSANFHRLKDHFDIDLNFPIPDNELYYDARIKHKNIEAAIKMSRSQTLNIDYSCDTEISEKLSEAYTKSNHNLASLLEQSLPAEYYNLTL